MSLHTIRIFPFRLAATLAAALVAMTLAMPTQAQNWPAANLSIPSGCSENNPTFALTELYRTGYGDGIGEPLQGFGITPAGQSILVREGANFAILYRMTACVNRVGGNEATAIARVTLAPNGNAKGWNLGATFTGDKNAAIDTRSGTVSRWGDWISQQHTTSGVTVHVLDIWVHGTTTDDNCIGTPTGSSATGSVEIYLLDGDGSTTGQQKLFSIRKVEDDTSTGMKPPCT